MTSNSTRFSQGQLDKNGSKTFRALRRNCLLPFVGLGLFAEVRTLGEVVNVLVLRCVIFPYLPAAEMATHNCHWQYG